MPKPLLKCLHVDLLGTFNVGPEKLFEEKYWVEGIVKVEETFPVLIKDEYTYSGPNRFALMNNFCKDFGGEQHFILFACHPDKFSSHEDAKVIELGKR
jgi:hypothetical protein